MNTCMRRDEVEQAVRVGQWPQGSPAELREHIAGCARCAEEARVLSGFAIMRDETMRMAVPQSSELLWWKAQLRRRHDAMQKLARPGFTISTATIVASVVLLVIVLTTVWKRVAWPQMVTMFLSTGRSMWVVVSVAVLLGGVAIAAVMLGTRLPEERS